MWNTNRANSERRALRGQAAAESNAQTKAASARREERFTSSAVNTEASMRASQEVPTLLYKHLKLTSCLKVIWLQRQRKGHMD